MEERSMGLTVRCKKFFGLKLGQTLAEFSAELRQLTPADKQEFTVLFNASGMPTVCKS